MPEIAVAREPVAALRRDPRFLLIVLEHVEETGPTVFSYDPDWPLVERLEAAGEFCAFAARHDGALIGLAGWRLLPILDCRGVIEAHASYFRVSAEWRSQGVPRLLLAACEDDMRAKGIMRLVLHDHVAAKRDYRGFGYMPYQRLWVREIGR